VILRDAASEAAGREAVFRAHGRAIERLGGLYITGEDVGTSPADMEIIRQETRHVAGLIADPSPSTARGVIGGCREILGWSQEEARRRIDGIYDTVLDVLRSGEAEGLPPHAAADRLAEERLATLEAERRQR
jgi:glutamate dehydrogenase/leucine dehydrogenase